MLSLMPPRGRVWGSQCQERNGEGLEVFTEAELGLVCSRTPAGRWFSLLVYLGASVLSGVHPQIGSPLLPGGIPAWRNLGLKNRETHSTLQADEELEQWSGCSEDRRVDGARSEPVYQLAAWLKQKIQGGSLAGVTVG